jgi:hypothetical protein
MGNWIFNWRQIGISEIAGVSLMAPALSFFCMRVNKIRILGVIINGFKVISIHPTIKRIITARNGGHASR